MRRRRTTPWIVLLSWALKMKEKKSFDNNSLPFNFQYEYLREFFLHFVVMKAGMVREVLTVRCL
jgi:hypothetical protein